MALRALCIGINDYPGTDSDLSGCVNDANDWQDALAGKGFDETAVMLDGQATKAAMVEAISKLVARTAPGDLAVITYSGHGSWIADEDGDEPDFRDETLCPHDIADGNYLSDDEIFDLFAERERGAKIVMISDSCHSGSVTRLAPPGAGTDNPTRVRFLAPEVFLPKKARDRAAKVANRPSGRPRHQGLLLAGCQDIEYSYDASFNGRPNGAFTYFALQTLGSLKKGATYRDWFNAIREKLPSTNHPQTPNLFGSSRQKRWIALG